MSHSRVQIYRDGKLAAFGLYYTVCDIVYRKLFKSSKEASQWMEDGCEGGMDVRCTCGHDPVPVTVYSEYGNETWWEAKACLQCMVLTENLEPYELVDWGNEEMVHGKPPFFVDQWSLD